MVSENQDGRDPTRPAPKQPRPAVKTVMGSPWDCKKCGAENPFTSFECSECKEPKSV